MTSTATDPHPSDDDLTGGDLKRRLARALNRSAGRPVDLDDPGAREAPTRAYVARSFLVTRPRSPGGPPRHAVMRGGPSGLSGGRYCASQAWKRASSSSR